MTSSPGTIGSGGERHELGRQRRAQRPGLRQGGGQRVVEPAASDAVGPGQRVDVDADHAGYPGDRGDDVRQGDRLSERAGTEPERVAQAVDDRGVDGRLLEDRVGRQVERRREGGRPERRDAEWHVRVALVADGASQQIDHVVGDGRTIGAGDRDEDAAPLAVPAPGRERLGDPGVGPCEVLVVAERDDAIERQHGQRSVVARGVPRLGVVAADGRRRVDRAP